MLHIHATIFCYPHWSPLNYFCMKSPNVIRIFNLFQISSKFHLTFATFVVILLSQLQWLKTQSRKSFVQTTVFHRDALAVIEFQKGPFKGKVISEFLSLEHLRSTSAFWSALVTLVLPYWPTQSCLQLGRQHQRQKWKNQTNRHH